MAKTESLRHVLLGQVGILPKSSQALGQLVGEVHAQKAWRKQISLMKSFQCLQCGPLHQVLVRGGTSRWPKSLVAS